MNVRVLLVHGPGVGFGLSLKDSFTPPALESCSSLGLPREAVPLPAPHGQDPGPHCVLCRHPVWSPARISRVGERLVASPPDLQAGGGLRRGCRHSPASPGTTPGPAPTAAPEWTEGEEAFFSTPFQVGLGKCGLEAPLKLHGALVTLA